MKLMPWTKDLLGHKSPYTTCPLDNSCNTKLTNQIKNISMNFKGCWKLSYPHCMWYLSQRNVDLKLDIPPVCTRQPEHGSAFCKEHSSCASKLGFKTSLRGFLKDCGVNGIMGIALNKIYCIIGYRL